MLKLLSIASLAMVGWVAAPAQMAAPPSPTAQAGAWKQVEGLGPHSKIIIKSDKQSAVCFVHFVEEQELTCSRSEDIGSESLAFPRGEIKSIKLARGGALGGMALGITDKIISPADDLFAGTVIYQR